MSALLLSFIPVVLHIVLLFNFNSWHSFSIHKSSFPLVIIISSGLIFIHSEIEFLPKKNLRYLITSALLSLVCFICYSGYKEYIKQVNPTYNYRINKVVGDAIQKYAKPEDVVFTDVSSCPELMFYSRRNSFNSSSIEESIEYMKGLNNAKDAIFIERYGQEIANIYRFNSSGEINLLWHRH